MKLKRKTTVRALEVFVFPAVLILSAKGLAIKKFMSLVVIIEDHDALRKFWIW